ncbi:unnamed protein product [Gongylonema pulchrum]|uniref:Ovule protein n=1 Tax=Gongylonema pulchrum TaxID=637853 RepID=A0A183DIK6_9BILA|nr:unnamed protein product [Gongylonema pulchrum]
MEKETKIGDIEDMPCCSFQAQREKQAKDEQQVDKVALLHQALSQASIVRAWRSKQVHVFMC